ncbi:hypothetical protein R3P38DRAFT_3218745 [Favolaschia claudopus]|uniref:Uncharacterized protein n=1 Tax=Favolaschia claudopus TaxID=2862362 RepID=A0AAW0A4P0_9AGAR
MRVSEGFRHGKEGVGVSDGPAQSDSAIIGPYDTAFPSTFTFKIRQLLISVSLGLVQATLISGVTSFKIHWESTDPAFDLNSSFHPTYMAPLYRIRRRYPLNCRVSQDDFCSASPCFAICPPRSARTNENAVQVAGGMSTEMTRNLIARVRSNTYLVLRQSRLADILIDRIPHTTRLVDSVLDAGTVGCTTTHAASTFGDDARLCNTTSYAALRRSPGGGGGLTMPACSLRSPYIASVCTESHALIPCPTHLISASTSMSGSPSAENASSRPHLSAPRPHLFYTPQELLRVFCPSHPCTSNLSLSSALAPPPLTAHRGFQFRDETKAAVSSMYPLLPRRLLARPALDGARSVQMPTPTSLPSTYLFPPLSPPKPTFMPFDYPTCLDDLVYLRLRGNHRHAGAREGRK